MNSRSIALNHIPRIPVSQGLGYALGFLDALGCCPAAAEGQGATFSTFPQVPLTREPTCTQAFDAGASGSAITPADTSGPSQSSGYSADLPWPGSLAHGSPIHEAVACRLVPPVRACFPRTASRPSVPARLILSLGPPPRPLSQRLLFPFLIPR